MALATDRLLEIGDQLMDRGNGSAELAVPVAIVLHIEAQDGQVLAPGNIHIAPRAVI